MAPVSSSGAAEARKRRKEIIQSQRGDVEQPPAVPTGDLSVSLLSADKDEKKPPKKRKMDETAAAAKARSSAAAAAAAAAAASEEAKRKTQIRYDPEIPMDKDQLAAWRREARRVRNRESAAASRQRIRSRIDELEDEVDQWKVKYQQAIERLASLQQSINADEEEAPVNV